MVEADLAPVGPYSMRVSTRHGSDATRIVSHGSYRSTIRVDERLERVQAWQRPDGIVCVRADSEAGVEQVRFVLGLNDDHSEFLERFADDVLLSRPIKFLRGLRPLRTATVAHALLRAVAGQLITAREAREIERRIVRSATPALEGLHAAPTCAELARFSPAELRKHGLHARRSATLVRLCGSIELERLKSIPTDAVAQRLERERGLGPWSVGVVSLEGLGRYERGLARDLGLVKLAAALWGRHVEAEETDALLEPYGEWAGLASVYLLAGYHGGHLILGDAHRDSRRRQDRRVAPGRAA